MFCFVVALIKPVIFLLSFLACSRLRMKTAELVWKESSVMIITELGSFYTNSMQLFKILTCARNQVLLSMVLVYHAMTDTCVWSTT